MVSFLIVSTSGAQVIPAPGAKLHYNEVMFEYEKVSGANQYMLQLAEDTAGNSFKNLITEQTDSSTAMMISGLDFGKKYKWRYAALNSAETPVWNGPYYFEIDMDSFIHKGIVNFDVTKNDTGNRGLIVIDATHTIVDRDGKLVWYMANVNWFFKFSTRSVSKGGVQIVYKDMAVKPEILDMRVTPAGTITCLKDSFAIDCDLNSNIIWQAPNDGRVSGIGGEGYNHDFKRLPNGNYMVLGNEAWRQLPVYTDTLKMKRKYPYRKIYNGNEYAEVESGTIIEYDRNGKVVWSWSSHNYLDSDALKPIPRNPAFEYQLRPHINAFSIDKDYQFVYAGFRDLSRIVKIEKSTGKVVDSWGSPALSGGAMHPVAFHLQHDANVLDNGNIAVFNSNDYPNRDSVSNVMLVSQRPKDSGRVIWQYNCELDSEKRREARNGGNVDQLKNGNYLVCMGNSDRIFEITKDKKIVWQGEIKMRDDNGINYAHRLYRAHYISSLYPCYFVFDNDADTIHKKASNLHVHIFNKGSEGDAYQVKVLTSSGLLIKQFTTAMLPANQSIVLPVGPLKHLGKGERVEINIRSITNPDFERSRWVVVN